MKDHLDFPDEVTGDPLSRIRGKRATINFIDSDEVDNISVFVIDADVGGVFISYNDSVNGDVETGYVPMRRIKSILL